MLENELAEPASVDGTRVLSRVAIRLIPFMFLLYILSYLDRINVSFAGLEMNRDLGFNEEVFGFGAAIFFIGYFLFGVPSNLVLERLGAKRVVATIMVVWGAITVALGFVKDASSFFLLRFFLGAAEAGFFPGMILYLTYWFPQKERGVAVARFMSAIPTAGVLGGLISSQILLMTGYMGLAGWKWLFIITGLPSILMGLLSLLFLTDSPQKATWLSQDEKKWLHETLEKDKPEKSENVSLLAQLKEPATMRVVALLSVIYFSLTLGMYGFQLWLPQILKGFGGLSDSTTALITAVPAIFQAIGMLVVAKSSDARGERRKHLAAAAFLASLGLVGTSFIGNPFLALITLSLTAFGIWGTVGPFWSMSTASLPPRVAAACIAFINSTGNLGGFVGPYLIGWIKKTTGHFEIGLYAMALSLAFAGTASLISHGLIKDRRKETV